MKVLLFINLVPRKPGAVEYLLASLGRACAAQGDTLTVGLAGEPVPEVAAWLVEAGVTWHVLEGWDAGEGQVTPWRFCGPALRLLRACRPDVAAVHFGNELPSLWVSLRARLGGSGRVKWVWQQDQQIAEPSFLTRHFSRIRLLTLTFAGFVAVYERGRKSLVSRGISTRRIAVILNGVRDHLRTRPKGWLKAELGIPADAVLAVTVSSLIRRKRVSYQLAALAGVRQACPRTHLVVVGEGPERDRLATLAAALKVTDCVHFLGLRQDTRDILHEADLLVHSSLAEASVYAIPEALCAGLPVIVTEAGAAREQVEDERCGYVLRQNDRAGFVRRWTELAQDAALRERLGRAARERWAARYDVEVAARAYHALYRRLAAGGRAGEATAEAEA